MQRLFSTFARGWPGSGLLAQRLVTAGLLFHSAIAHTLQATYAPFMVLQMIAAAAGLFLLLGLWTPAAGTTLAITELALLITHRPDPWLCVLLATLGVTLAMIGPGAWSIDARLFGRKQIRF